MGLFRRKPQPALRHMIEKGERVVTPREMGELDALRALQEARAASEQAQDIRLGAERACRDAEESHDFARREMRRIAEQKVRPPHAS